MHDWIGKSSHPPLHHAGLKEIEHTTVAGKVVRTKPRLWVFTKRRPLPSGSFESLYSIIAKEELEKISSGEAPRIEVRLQSALLVVVVCKGKREVIFDESCV